MEVLLPIDSLGNFSLPAISALRQVPATALCRHDSIGLRSAVGIYNTSVAAIAQRLARTTRLLDIVVTPQPGKLDVARSPKEDLLESYESLLHSLMQHMEDCVGVLKGFGRDDRAFAKHSAVKEYRRSVRAYRSHIGIVVNRIKHQQAACA